MYDEDEFLALSGIQHFAFCRRQWALIHIEQAWDDNVLTAEGEFMHRRAHDEELRERRGDTIVVRGLAVHSRTLGLSGKCDVVEFRKDSGGHPLAGEDGLWRAVPVEYKRGRSKVSDADRLQLCAQALCLEEMLGADVPEGCLFYDETRSRERVPIDGALRAAVVSMAEEMHDLYRRRRTPKVKPFAACRSCSLCDICLPHAINRATVGEFVAKRLAEEAL
ncbi:CRISPR-associated protein Cas4 [Enteroscipio rubneri]|uniref:CRISPR-associated exonuclease Cas4 n=1 Tax=Enteroscipio rubneri TaxID=2070686 RepID=A0A2K2UAM5_9ACTN|nr:CRISPR-associated protein Cas4 [Enteroscipio rubneri]PNV67366.1 CRISPR-associated protein Cas4 [Enteroscipio rubneri]